jgi:nucleotide-binding universal stress UspA family protein
MDTIVVGVDGSTHADIALRWAVREAELTGAELYLVYAYSRRLGREHSPDKNRELAEKMLESVVERNRTALDAVPWRSYAQSAGRGSPATVLIDEAQQADLIVVGNRGGGGFSELILGSTSYRLTSGTTTPVVVVRADLPTEVVDDPFPLDVVVGVDGSDSGDRALRWAASEARRRNVTLNVLHAQPLPTHSIYAMSAVPDMDRERDLVISEGEQIISRALEHAGDALDDLEVRTHPLVGPIADALVSFAGSRRLIVVGARGHSYVVGLLLGSTSHQVLHYAKAPVVIVP